MPYLIVENGPLKGKKFPLADGGTILFGRDPRADISIDDHLCSRRHFVVEAHDGQYFVSDLGSSNGTYLNDARLEVECSLAQGDAVRAGETLITFLTDEVDAKGLAGKEVGGYRILERIGRGGMGTVFKALQVSLNRVVALKILSSKYGQDPAFITRFQREAQAAGRLNHPNIVQVYDVGRDRDLHYFSMEFIENGSVQDLADRSGTLDTELALSIILDAARGLEYAEKKGLVHRDIKPDNLMVNAEGVVKIADLGLARAEGGEPASEDEGAIFGTPHFIAPEQALGQKVDTRSDMYSLGASFYRLLTGRTPFSSEEGVREIIYKQIHEDPPPIREFNKAVPAPIVTIVERMMRKDPTERFQKASDLVESLEAAERSLQGGGSKKVVLVGGALLLLVAAGAFYFLSDKDKPKEPPTPIRHSKPDDKTNVPRDDRPDPVGDAAIREREAQIALQTVMLAAAKLETRDEATLTPLIARFQTDVVDAFDDVASIKARAQEQINALQSEIKAQKEAAAAIAAEAKEAKQKADAVVSTLTGAVREALSKDEFGRALRAIDEARLSPDLRGRPELGALDALVVESQSLAGTRTEALLREATTMAQDGAFDRAMKFLEAKAIAFETELPNTLEGEPIVGLVARLRTAGKTFVADKLAQRRENLAADQALGFDKRREALVSLTKGVKPAPALLLLTATLEAMKSPEWKAMLAEDVEDVKATQRVLDAILAYKVSEGDEVTLPNARGDGVIAWDLVSVDASGFKVKRARIEKELLFEELTPRELGPLFLDGRRERVPLNPLDEARMLLVSGAPDAAKERLSGVANVPPALLARIEAEAAATAILRQIRSHEADAKTNDQAYLELLPLLEKFLKDHRATQTFVRNSSGKTPIIPLPE